MAPVFFCASNFLPGPIKSQTWPEWSGQNYGEKNMPLNWNVKNCDPKFTHAKADAEWPNPTPNFGGEPIDREAEYMRPETEILIYHTLAVGMGSITQKNYNEFYMRVLIWEALESGSKHSEGSAEYWNRRDGTNFKAGDSFITWERVRGHIGLCTNVSTESRPKWIKRFCDRFVEDYDRIGLEKNWDEAAE